MTVKPRRHLHPDEVCRLTEAAGMRGRHPFRDRALIQMMCRYGLRASDAVSMRWDQIDLEAGTLYVGCAKSVTPIAHSLGRDELDNLRRLRGAGTTPFVFETERGGPLSSDALQYIVREAVKLAALEVRVHPQMLRRAAEYASAHAAPEAEIPNKAVQSTIRQARALTELEVIARKVVPEQTIDAAATDITAAAKRRVLSVIETLQPPASMPVETSTIAHAALRLSRAHARTAKADADLNDAQDQLAALQRRHTATKSLRDLIIAHRLAGTEQDTDGYRVSLANGDMAALQEQIERAAIVTTRTARAATDARSQVTGAIADLEQAENRATMTLYLGHAGALSHLLETTLVAIERLQGRGGGFPSYNPGQVLHRLIRKAAARHRIL